MVSGRRACDSLHLQGAIPPLFAAVEWERMKGSFHTQPPILFALPFLFLPCAGEPDEAFLMDLLICFWQESLERLAKLKIAACMEGTPAHGPLSFVHTLREESHAIKGSALTVRLWRLAKVSGVGWQGLGP